MRFKDRIARFMYGRYGGDRLGNTVNIAALVLIFVNMLIRNTIVNSIISLAITGMLVYVIWRMMSRNIYKRAAEERKFLAIWGRVKGFFKLSFDRIRYCKSSVFKKCPHCKAQLRLPRKKGEHTVRCPRCGERFNIVI